MLAGMAPGRFVELPVPPAICDAAGARRMSARRIWVDQVVPSVDLRTSANLIAERCPPTAGRVHGIGEFEDEHVRRLLMQRRPGGRNLELRPRFEWYACRGACFHNDAHYSDVIFGAWCLAGPGREIVFPRARLRIRAEFGDLVMFDPFEPHAVLDPAQQRYERSRYEGSAPSVFVGLELTLDPATCRLFGIDALLPAKGDLLSSAVAINAETGALA
jgi:hypothetical protein